MANGGHPKPQPKPENPKPATEGKPASGEKGTTR